MALSGKVCLVTGATRGIGKGIALQLGEAGAKVYITGRTLKPKTDVVGGSLEETAKEIEARGGKCVPVVCDHGKDEQVKQLFDKISKDEDGQLDVLVNNAYTAVTALSQASGVPFWEQNDDMWDVVNHVGLRNHYLCTVHASRLMVARKTGLIVNISSAGGLRYTFNVAYGIGKAALDRMAADCAIELRKHGVSMVSLWPGAVKTEKVMDMIKDSSFMIGATKDNPNSWQKMKTMFESGESIEYAGKAIVELARHEADTRTKTGRILLTADLGDQYGFTDVDGSRPPNMRAVKTVLFFYGWTKTASWVPTWVKIPRSLMALGASKF